MSIIHKFLVDGSIVTVPEEELEEFYAAMSESGVEYQEVESFEDKDGNPLNVPVGERDEFMSAMANGETPIRNMRTVLMDDGQELNLGEEDVRQFVQARQTGMPMSRGLLANTGIPDWYGKSREDREALADKFAAMFPLNDGPKPDYLPRERNLGDAITDGIDAIRSSPAVAGAVGAVKGFGEGLARSVTDSDALWRETYGDDVADMLQNANANIGGLAKKIAELGPAGEELLAEATKFMDPEGAARLREEAAADRQWIDENINTQRPKLANDTLDSVNEWMGDTLNTIGTFAIPGSAAVDISAQTANAFYDAYDKAMKAGNSSDKAEALATAKAGATAAMGVVLGKAAKGARSAAGFRGALADMAVTGGEMGALGGVNEVIDEGIEGAENPDWGRVGKKTLEEAGKGAAFGGISRLAHGIAEGESREAASDARRAAQEREEATAKEVARNEARTRYEANLSEEALNDIENRVNDMVKSGVIPSYRHAQEVERLAAEKLGGREAGESTEAVEQAVMEAAQEVSERLQTPERVTSPSLERRQTEAKMRENERLTKIGEQMGEEIANEKPIVPTEDAEAVKADEAERVKRRKADFEAALEDGDINRNTAQVDNQTPENGEIVSEKPVETAENVQSQLSKAYSDYVDAAANRLKGGKSDFEAANKAAQDAAKRMVETDEPLPTDAEIDEIVSRLPEKARETFANSLKQQRDWVAEQREVAKEEAETTEKPVEASTKPENRGEVAHPAKPRDNAPLDEPKDVKPVDKIRSAKTYEEMRKAYKDIPVGVNEKDLVDASDEFERRAELFSFADDVKNGKVDSAYYSEADAYDIVNLIKEGNIPEDIKGIKGIAEEAEKLLALKEGRNQTTKVPDGRGKMVEKKQTEQPSQPLENAPSRVPQEKGTTSQADGAEGVEARNGVSGDAHAANVTKVAEIVASQHGMEVTDGVRKTAEKVATAIENKDAATLKQWMNGLNNGVVKAFSEITGLKMPRTQKGQREVIDRFCNGETEPTSTHRIPDGKGRTSTKPLTDLSDSAPLKRNVEGIKAEEKAAKARFKGEREQVFGEIDDIIKQKVDAVRGSWSKEIAEEVDGILKKTKLTNEDIRKLNTYLIDAPKGEKPFKIKLGETGELTVNDNIDALLKTRNNVRSLGRQASKRYYEIDEQPSEAEEPVSMRRLDPKLRSDPKAVEWAKKKGFSVVDGKITPEARRIYDEDVTKKTASAAKRWFPDMKIVQHKHGENIEHGQEVIDLRDTSGNTLGWFNPSNKEVHLLPGANSETVAHEIMWHGTRDWATTEAAKGDEAAKKLIATMKDVEQNVPDALKNKVTRLYRANGVSSADVLFNEWGAWFTQGKGGAALESAMETAEGRKWYAKALATVKDVYKDYMSAHGGNRADISEIDGMTRDQFVDWLSKNFAGGKTLGEIGTPKDTTLSTEETLKQKARRIAYDSVAPVRDLEREIEKKTGVKISAEDSVDAALALRPGEHEAVTINQQRKLREVKDMLKKYGISSEDLGYYMALKAAPGRDAKIDAKNLAKIEAETEAEVRKEWGSKRIEQDEAGFKAELEKRLAEKKSAYVSTNGSAVDPREVAKMVPEIENGSKSIEYGAARDKIREIQEDTMDALVDAGLISKKDAEKLRKEEPDYVPFKSEFDAETGEFVGRAYNNLAKKTFYEAKGRQSSAGDILAHILNDNAMAHNKAIENKAREKLAKLVEAHTELGTVSALGNRNLTEARRKQGGNANVILFKREGKTYAIELNGSRGKAVAAAFTGANQAKMPGWAQKASRAWASTATELSPTFAIRNVTKDNLELAQNVIKEMGYVKGTKFIGKYVANQAKSSGSLLKYVTTGKIDTSSTSGGLLQEFIDNGGMIGGYGTEGYSEISSSLSYEQIEKEMKRGTSMTKAVANHALHSIGYLNKMSEMTSRFNAYRTAVEMGMTPKEAALWSRRTLTDFNRKGDMTGVTNVLRMFSNSTLGSTAKAATGLVTTKGGLALSAGLLANGAAQALIEHFTNADEDEKNAKLGKGTGKDVSEYDRKSSFWLHRNAKTGKITKVGAHNGPFQLVNYIGNCAMRVALGDMTAKDMAKELGMSAAELASAFSGWGEVNFDSQEDGAIGAIKAFAASAVPSASQFIVETALNTDYAGRKVYTEKGPSEKNPYYLRARKNTPEWAKNASEMMNRVTGGNEARSGWFDVPAEVIQKVAESFGKNAAKDVITAYETGKAIVNGKYGDLETRMVPVKRDFKRDAPDSTSRYFNAKRDFEKDAAEFTGLRKTMSADERKEYIDEHPWVLRIDAIRKAINEIDDLRKYEAGFVKDGRGYIKRREEPSKEFVEKWKAKRLKLQAKILELMGR